MSYAGNTFTRNWVVNEKENPTTGTPYAWVRARVLGGKTNFWGRGALRYGPYEFKAASHDGYDVDWPIGYEDVRATTTRWTCCSAAPGSTEGLDQVPDGVFQTPSKLNCVETVFRNGIAKMGRQADSRPCRRHDRRRAEQQVPRSAACVAGVAGAAAT